jgi:hypothetical protein
VKAGLLHDLLTRGLDTQGRLRDPVAHPKQFKDSPLGRIPRERGITRKVSNPKRRRPDSTWAIWEPTCRICVSREGVLLLRQDMRILTKVWNTRRIPRESGNVGEASRSK